MNHRKQKVSMFHVTSTSNLKHLHRKQKPRCFRCQGSITIDNESKKDWKLKIETDNTFLEKGLKRMDIY